MIRCCKDCTERRMGCHSGCEKYISEKKRIDQISEKRYAANKLEDDYRIVHERRFRK